MDYNKDLQILQCLLDASRWTSYSSSGKRNLVVRAVGPAAKVPSVIVCRC